MVCAVSGGGWRIVLHRAADARLHACGAVALGDTSEFPGRAWSVAATAGARMGMRAVRKAPKNYLPSSRPSIHTTAENLQPAQRKLPINADSAAGCWRRLGKYRK